MEFLKNGFPQKCRKPLKYKDFSHFCKTQFCCEYVIVTEQKARVTYDNILRLCDDPDVRDPIKYLREREIVHYQRFADANLPHSNRFFELLKHEFYKKRTHNKSLSQPNRGDRLLCFGTLGIRYHLAVKVR